MIAESTEPRDDSTAFEKHGYSPDELARQGETLQLKGLKVLCGHHSCEAHATFDTIPEMLQSDWKVDFEICARSSEGTVLYEGACPQHPDAIAESETGDTDE